MDFKFEIGEKVTIPGLTLDGMVEMQAVECNEAKYFVVWLSPSGTVEGRWFFGPLMRSREIKQPNLRTVDIE